MDCHGYRRDSILIRRTNMNDPIKRYPPHCLVPHDATLVHAEDYDALAAAARKVCCGRCGLFPDEQSHDECTADCPDCADLRKLLEGER